MEVAEVVAVEVAEVVAEEVGVVVGVDVCDVVCVVVGVCVTVVVSVVVGVVIWHWANDSSPPGKNASNAVLSPAVDTEQLAPPSTAFGASHTNDDVRVPLKYSVIIPLRSAATHDAPLATGRN